MGLTPCSVAIVREREQDDTPKGKKAQRREDAESRRTESRESSEKDGASAERKSFVGACKAKVGCVDDTGASAGHLRRTSGETQTYKVEYLTFSLFEPCRRNHQPSR